MLGGARHLTKRRTRRCRCLGRGREGRLRRWSSVATRVEQSIARQQYQLVDQRGMLHALGARRPIEFVPAGMLSWHQLAQKPIALGQAQILHLQITRIMVLVRLALEGVCTPNPVRDRHSTREAQFVPELRHLRIELLQRRRLTRRRWRSCVRMPQHLGLIHRRREHEALLRRRACSRRSCHPDRRVSHEPGLTTCPPPDRVDGPHGATWLETTRVHRAERPGWTWPLWCV